MIVVY